MSVNEQQRAEVDWYRRNGRYPERIKLDSGGAPYVLGDASWNRAGRPHELIEGLLPRVPILKLSKDPYGY